MCEYNIMNKSILINFRNLNEGDSCKSRYGVKILRIGKQSFAWEQYSEICLRQVSNHPVPLKRISVDVMVKHSQSWTHLSSIYVCCFAILSTNPQSVRVCNDKSPFLMYMYYCNCFVIFSSNVLINCVSIHLSLCQVSLQCMHICDFHCYFCIWW